MNRLNRLSIAIALLSILTLGQTTTPSSSVDLSGVVSVFTVLITAILPILVIVMILKLFTNIFEGFGKIFMVKIRSVGKYITPPTLLLTLAQTTNTTSIDISGVANVMTSLLYALLPVIIVIAIVGLFMRLFSRLPNMI